MRKLQAPIKGIFFDIGWTLYYEVSKKWFFNKKFIGYIDINIFEVIPKYKKDSAFKRALKYLDDNHLLMTEDDELKQFETFYSMLANDLPELGLNIEQVKEIAYSEVFDASNYSLFNDTLSTLEVLKGKYKLGVISDTWPSVELKLKSHRIYNYFDTKTFSCFLGTWKPDERMYRHALEQMKLPSEQTIFIDDGVENLEGAEKCGIQPVLITAKPNPESTDKYPSIKNLSDLFDLLPESH